MSVYPEGYAVAPTSTDHMVKLAVPVPGHSAPVLIEAPRIGWLAPAEVDACESWGDEISAADNDVKAWRTAKDEFDAKLVQWHEDNDALPEAERAPEPTSQVGPFPAKKAKLIGDGDPVRQRQLLREMRLRWIKSYIAEDDYDLLVTSDKIPERTITWIFDELSKPGDITLGESEASTDS